MSSFSFALDGMGRSFETRGTVMRPYAKHFICSTCLNTKEFHEYTCISYSLRDIYELLSGTCFYIFKRESICVNPRQYVRENVLLVTDNGRIY